MTSPTREEIPALALKREQKHLLALLDAGPIMRGDLTDAFHRLNTSLNIAGVAPDRGQS